MSARRLTLAARCLLSLSLAASGVAADAPAPIPPESDWPCEQVLVERIEPGVIWAGPSIEGLDWRADAQVAGLVTEIARSDPGADEAAITGFAAGLVPESREQRLTLVFAGLVEVLNQERSAQIGGIKRYSRDQARRAEALAAALDRLVVLEREVGGASTQERRDIEQGLALQERVFDEREKAITFLCGRPVATEQRLGRLARLIDQLREGPAG